MQVNMSDSFRLGRNNNKSFQVILIFSSAKLDFDTVDDNRLKSDCFWGQSS